MPRELRMLASHLARGEHKLAMCLLRRCPYGLWICADGRQVLHDRAYKPIWSRSADGIIEVADPDEWVPDIERREPLFSDRRDPWAQYDAMKRLRAIMVEWGLIRPARGENFKLWKQRREQKRPAL